MRDSAWLNNQKLNNLLWTPPSMKFTASGFPIVAPLQDLPNKKITGFLPFNFTLSNDISDKAIHFHIQDYLFERVWNTPNRYIETLKKSPLVSGPDFSMFLDMPYPLQVFSCYKTKWLEAYWQANGITVAPNICWSDSRSFSWCFDGDPVNSIVNISAIGCLKEEQSRKMFLKGYRIAQERLKPKLVILHCSKSYAGLLEKESICPVRFVKYSYING